MSTDSEGEVVFEESDSSDDYQAPAKVARTTSRAPTPKVPKDIKALNAKKQAPLCFGNGDGMSAEAPVSKSTASTSGSKKRAVEEIYKQKTPIEHILLRPDTYIGSVEMTATPLWVMHDGKMSYRTVNFVPGLYKIFDEILVNAADNKVRDPSMDTIKVSISRADNTISVMNNGKGVPVSIHSEAGVYVPELIFGHLLTSSNYDDDDKKVVGGRNGYGAKLCNIFSTEFIVETSDKESGHKYKQVFNNNMSKKSKPKLTNAAKNDFTKISFKPDLEKFGMTELDDDIISVLTKRVFDMAGVVPDVKVYLNDERIKIKNFKEYVKLYMDSVESEIKPTLVYERPHPRWEVCFAVSEAGQFNQVSFVNSICTSKGGTHVAMITDQIVAKANEIVRKKNKGEALKPHQIKSHIWLFINCQIENPSFDSQTKENMTLKASKFGSKCVLSEDFLKKVFRTGIVENIMQLALMKQANQLKQKDGTKRTRLSGITKLDDANNAGTRQGQKCTLILTEGDSAKALAISGLSVVGRDNFGVFPLRGKLLNVREATHKQIMENAEINHIKQILGLKSDKKYTSTESLRYGHVMIMADQDHDGSHIKGLIINLFDHFWPSLLENSGFLLQFITPIVKVSKGNREINFYNIPEYEAWKEANNSGKGWVMKYYKGLGTSTAADAKKYFSRMDDHLKPFAKAKEEDRQHINLAFNKKKADDRKDWLANLTDGTFIDHTMGEIPIREFVNKELILFSMADNVRSIPSAVDGFKPGQRKILFSCFKRNLTKAEIKVAQLAGYVSEHSAYHHGEASLQSTIINLAQDYVGSNNLNILEPRGQFGTRLQGGKDHAHARYIFTKLPPIARMIYHSADDKLLKYLNEENLSIEPEWYMPILPMVLVNGAEGIGTGWSTSLPNYNPRDIVNNLQRRLNGEDFQAMHPWYRGFKGTIELQGDKYKVSGILKKIDATTLEITELPLGSWTQSYKEFLEGLLAGTEKIQPAIKDYREYHTDTAVHFVVELTPEQMAKAESEGLEKKFKITTSKSVGNMVLFDQHGRLKKYDSVSQILEEFYLLRLEYYGRRKDWLVAKLRRELSKIENQVRFVLEVISGELVVHNRKRTDVVQQLKARKYAPILKSAEETAQDASTDNAAEMEDIGDGDQNGYDYLLTMPILNLTMEKVKKLTSDRDAKRIELDELLATATNDLWRRDLDSFMDEWNRFEISIEETVKNATTKGKKGKSVNVEAARNKKRKLLFSKPQAWSFSDVDDDVDDPYIESKSKKLATPRTRVARATAPRAAAEDTATNLMTPKPELQAKVSTATTVTNNLPAPVPQIPTNSPSGTQDYGEDKENSEEEDVVSKRPPKAAKKRATLLRRAPASPLQDVERIADDPKDLLPSKPQASRHSVSHLVPESPSPSRSSRPSRRQVVADPSEDDDSEYEDNIGPKKKSPSRAKPARRTARQIVPESPEPLPLTRATPPRKPAVIADEVFAVNETPPRPKGSPSVPGKQRRITDLFPGMRALSAKREAGSSDDTLNNALHTSGSDPKRRRKNVSSE